jgi:GT2 family glycosyltransferase
MHSDVTVVMTIRETFSTSVTALTSILENTSNEVEIVFIASGFPEYTMADLRKIAGGRNVNFIEIDQFLTPTQARNIALTYVKTKYVAFVDNDVIVQEKWLDHLVECAAEENATLVVPLIFERFPPWRYIHVAGGEGKIIQTPEGHRVCHQLPHFMHHDSEKTPVEFERSESTLVEFHTLLGEVEFFKEIGGMDEEIRCMYEEWDVCIQAIKRNKKIFFEPKSKIAYLPPRNVNEDDIRYFNLRWSEHWLNESVQRMIDKYDLTPGMGNLKAGRTFVKDHRLHKYGKLRKHLQAVLGNKGASVFMNRIVSILDKFSNSIVIRDDYKKWRAYTNARSVKQ